MMLTQRFAPEDTRREGAFLWNYAGMNVGFFVGFTAAGYFQATESYSRLFIFATLGNFVAIVLAALTWKTLDGPATRRCSRRAPGSSGCACSRASASSWGWCRWSGSSSSTPTRPRRW